MCSQSDDLVAREQQAQRGGGLGAEGALKILRGRTTAPETQRAIGGGNSDELVEQIREQYAGSPQLSDEVPAFPVMEPQPGRLQPDPPSFWLGE